MAGGRNGIRCPLHGRRAKGIEIGGVIVGERSCYGITRAGSDVDPGEPEPDTGGTAAEGGSSAVVGAPAD